MLRNINIIILATFCLPIIASIKFSDIIPIKFDVIKVRTPAQVESWRGRGHAVLDFPGLVHLHPGYTAEEHRITTYDGYKLKVHRITGSPKNPRAPGKPVVFLQHGMTATSDSFILVGPGHDLAYLLADDGYDVWFGNARGNTYSRGHVKLDPDKDPEFWDFSWHEIGTIDLPRMIDYALSVAKQPQLIYIGHSMGTTASYALLSKLPQYNQKISTLISLAPIAFWKEPLPLTFKLAADNFLAFQAFSKSFEMYEVAQQSEFLINLAKIFCEKVNQPIKYRTCALLLNEFMPMVDLTRVYEIYFPELLSYMLGGASIKTIFHYIQNTFNGEPQEYDYGPEINLKKYNQKTPPLYNLSLITTPTILINGPSDYFGGDKMNLELLKSKLPNVILSYKIPHKNFNHIDFLLAKDAKELVYNYLLKVMSFFENFNPNALPSRAPPPAFQFR